MVILLGLGLSEVLNAIVRIPLLSITSLSSSPLETTNDLVNLPCVIPLWSYTQFLEPKSRLTPFPIIVKVPRSKVTSRSFLSYPATAISIRYSFVAEFVSMFTKGKECGAFLR